MTVHEERREDMKHVIKQLKRVPWWGWAFGFGYFALQYGMYRLGELLSRLLGTTAWAFECKIPFLDDLFPLVPAFSVIYVFVSYSFWISGPVTASLTKRRNFVNYIIGLSLAYVVGFLFFVFMPTYMDRAKEGLMNVGQQTDFFNKLLAWVYAADGSQIAFNLLPSYHCLISAYCYLGIRRQPEISKGYKVFSFALVIAICLSTLYTKQHYIVDVFGGVGIAVACYAIVEKLDPGRRWAEARA